MKTYGHIRVSNQDQNEDRQLIAMKDLVIPQEILSVPINNFSIMPQGNWCMLNVVEELLFTRCSNVLLSMTKRWLK